MEVKGENFDEGMMHHLLSIGGKVHIVLKYREVMGIVGGKEEIVGGIATLFPSPKEMGTVSCKSYGYVGSYMKVR